MAPATPRNGFLLARSWSSRERNPAPLIYTSATQIAAVVPDLALGSRAQVTVTYEGRTSTSYRTQLLLPATPGVFTLYASGKGQAVALNQDGSLNTASNPAKVGKPAAQCRYSWSWEMRMRTRPANSASPSPAHLLFRHCGRRTGGSHFGYGAAVAGSIHRNCSTAATRIIVLSEVTSALTTPALARSNATAN